MAVVKKTFRYANVFLLQPLIPAFCISERIFGKRFKLIRKWFPKGFEFADKKILARIRGYQEKKADGLRIQKNVQFVSFRIFFAKSPPLKKDRTQRQGQCNKLQ